MKPQTMGPLLKISAIMASSPWSAPYSVTRYLRLVSSNDVTICVTCSFERLEAERVAILLLAGQQGHQVYRLRSALHGSACSTMPSGTGKVSETGKTNGRLDGNHTTFDSSVCVFSQHVWQRRQSAMPRAHHSLHIVLHSPAVLGAIVSNHAV